MLNDGFLIFLIVWIAVSCLSCLSTWLYQHDVRRRSPVQTLTISPVVIIIPIRGVPPNLAELLHAICAQQYTHWRLLFVVESSADPAYATLNALLATCKDASRIEIIVAGLTIDSGQKVHNQLVALQHLNAQDEVVVFADADIIPSPDWLLHIIDSLDRPRAWVISGYRWLKPTDHHLATLFVCQINTAIGTLPRLKNFNLAWGGTMALKCSKLTELDLVNEWHGHVSDDLQLTKTTWKQRGAINNLCNLLVPSPVSYNWMSAIEFIRRQYILLRLYTPLHWFFSFTVNTLMLMGWIIAILLAVSGSYLAISSLVLVILFNEYRAYLRRKAIFTVLGEIPSKRIRLWERWGAPVLLFFHVILIASTLFSHTITWGGRTYKINRFKKLKIS